MIDSLYEKFKPWSEKGSIWIISDTHFDDSDCKLMNPNWITPREHMDILKKEIHKNDTLIHLGDVGDVSYLSELKCYKVLITGNHDASPALYKRILKKEIYDVDDFSEKELRKKLLNENKFCTVDIYESYEFHAPFHRYIAIIDNHLFDEVYTGPLFIADRIILSHEPIKGLESFALNIHGHVHNGYTVSFYDIGTKFRISHINLASDIVQFKPCNLKTLIKSGFISEIPNYHRLTIDKATERKECKMNNRFLSEKKTCEECEYNHICKEKD